MNNLIISKNTDKTNDLFDKIAASQSVGWRQSAPALGGDEKGLRNVPKRRGSTTTQLRREVAYPAGGAQVLYPIRPYDSDFRKDGPCGKFVFTQFLFPGFDKIFEGCIIKDRKEG